MPLVWVVMLGVGLILAACGSGGESPEPTGTESSQRVERAATVSEQQTQQQTVEPQPLQQAQQMEQAEVEPEQPQPIQVEEEEIDTEPEVDALPPEIVGEHKGVRSEGRVLGEPEAPVLIEHFGDFT